MNNMDSFFYMRFEKDILLILIEAGDNGLSVNKISRHVFNTHNSFFLPLDYEKVHSEVLQCLQKNEPSKRAYDRKSKERCLLY